MFREYQMKLSKHATKRNNQRGFSKTIIDNIIKYGSSKYKDGNAVEIQVKKHMIHELIENLKKEIKEIEKLKGKALLLSGDNDTIITMYNIH